ncbi:MAG: SHOCT domain-containing protein, partial [Candidatus Poseidoniia archaeon]|nr:SHOCT domain-containing protein [Candidatus Poseidoniia archaeon]
AITSLLKLERDGLIGPTVTEALGKLPPEGVGDAYAKLGLHKEANEWYTSHGLLEKASATRRKEAEQGAVKVDQTVVHGDQVTKTEIKDSVLNRSNVGGGSSKMQELEKLTEMKKEGLIDDDEFKQMKKEILGK